MTYLFYLRIVNSIEFDSSKNLHIIVLYRE